MVVGGYGLTQRAGRFKGRVRYGLGLWLVRLRSFARGTVDAFAEQVCVTEVPRLLLDEVEIDPAQGVRLGPAEGIVERQSGDHLP
jgi:hypothetical protein